MFWNKKEEKTLPDLPPLKPSFNKNSAEKVGADSTKESEDLSDEKNEEDEEVDKHSLPSFPDSPINAGFSQEAIKDAIGREEIKEDKPSKMPDGIILGREKKFKTIELDDTKSDEPMENPYLNSIGNSSLGAKKKTDKPTINYNPPYSEKESLAIGLPPEDEEIGQDQSDKKISQQKGDVFVKIDKFFSAKKAIDSIDDQVNEIDSVLKKIRETKLKEERELSNWERQIAMIKSRIQEINENIFDKLQ